MVASINGHIAKNNGDYPCLESKDLYEKGVTLSEQDITNYLNTIDYYIMGSKTYEHLLHLKDVKTDKDGMVELTYDCKY